MTDTLAIDPIPKDSPLSTYQPTGEIVDFMIQMKKDYSEGVRILTTPWLELNDRSVIEDENRGQMMFNAFVDTSSEDPNLAHEWKGTRSMARNKAISMHHNLTANFLLPMWVAQNDDDEVDKDFSEVMRDLTEWLAQPTNSNYQSSFLQIVFGMETNPVTFLEADFCEVYQKIKEKQQNGKYKTVEILDEVLSGFQANVMSASQVLISNAYERNIQKQRVIIPRKYKEYKELETKHGHHKNWEHVQEGIKSVYNDEDGLFYDIRDDEHPHLCAEEIWKCRQKDMEVPTVNGIYLGDEDVEGGNPIKHRDNRNCPKYNVIPFGYYRIGDHFFYYKSMMNALGWDNMLIDAMYEVGMNNELLQSKMPIVISGSDKVDSEVVVPGAVLASEDVDFKAQPLLPPMNNTGLVAARAEIEKSMADASVNETMSGDLPEASQKAYTVAQATQNAKTMIKGVGQSLAESIIQYGSLMKDIVINHITVPEVEELVGGKMKLRYKSFFLGDKESGGKMKDKVIKFDEKLIGLKLTEKQKKERNIKMYEDSENKKGKDSPIHVNPELFAKFKYLCKVDIEEMFVKGQEYWQPVLSALYAQLANNPYVDQEGLLRKLLYSYFQSDGDDLVKEQPLQLPGEVPMDKGRGTMANKVQEKAVGKAIGGNVL